MLPTETALSFPNNSESSPCLSLPPIWEASARILVMDSPGAPSPKTGLSCVQPGEEGYSCFYSPLRCCNSKFTKHVYSRQFSAWFTNQNSELLECQELKSHWAIRNTVRTHSQRGHLKSSTVVLPRICLCCVLAQKFLPPYFALVWLLLILRPQHKCHLVRKPHPDHPAWARSPSQCFLNASCSLPSQHWSQWIIIYWLARSLV